MQYLDVISKTTEWSLFISKANHSISQDPNLCPEQKCWRSWSWTALWRPTRPSRIKKDVLLIIGDWNANVGSQEIPGVMGKFGLGVQNEVRKRLTEFCQENTLVIANTLFQQHKRRVYTWTLPDGQYQNQIDYILSSQRWRSSIQSQEQDQELTVAQIMISLLPNSDLNWRK